MICVNRRVVVTFYFSFWSYVDGVFWWRVSFCGRGEIGFIVFLIFVVFMWILDRRFRGIYCSFCFVVCGIKDWMVSCLCSYGGYRFVFRKIITLII